MLKATVNLLCRVCGQSEETIIHLLCAYSALEPTCTVYFYCVAKVLDWHLSQVLSLPLSSISWCMHSPMPVSESLAAKLLWDFNLVTETHHPSNTLDVVLFDYAKSATQCFAQQTNKCCIAVKETEKLQNYLQ